MKIKRYLISSILLLLFVVTLSAQEIITTTSVLSSAIKEIVKDKFKVEALVPSGYCPGHFDIKGKHLASIEKSGLLFAQGFEPYLEQIKETIKNPDFSSVIVRTDGSWFTLENQKKIYREIKEKLSEKFPQYKEFFENNYKKAVTEIENTDKRIKDMLKEKKLEGLSVICNSHIREMLEYLGFNVAGTYGRKEELTPSEIKNLLNKGKQENVSLVIDNLQAGSDTGRIIADELKVPHITISNFPQTFPDTPTLRDTLYKNAERIIEIYEKNKVR